MPLDNSDEEDDPPEPTDTEETLQTEEVGQICVKDLDGKTLISDDITTEAKVIETQCLVHLENAMVPEDQRRSFCGQVAQGLAHRRLLQDSEG